MPLQSLGKVLLVLGALLLALGVLLLLGARFGLGNLPGDFSWKRGQTSISIPIVSSIVLSIVLTLVLNFLMRFFR
jgi:hypothetical protein